MRSAAGGACPAFPGKAIRAHRGLADPAGVPGGDDARDAAFTRTWELLRHRIEAMPALPIETMAHEALEQALGKIGRMDGAA